jgi:hypothetical protein
MSRIARNRPDPVQPFARIARGAFSCRHGVTFATFRACERMK